MKTATLTLLTALSLASCVEVEIPETAAPLGGEPCEPTTPPPGVCAPRAGVEFDITFVTLPGNDCGPIAGGGAYIDDPTEACETTSKGETYEETIYWDADGRTGHGLLVYASHYSQRLGGLCSGAYAVTYTVR